MSNGLIRVSSNLTRVYSIASVDVQILRPQDLDRAIAVAGRVGRELEDDEALGGRLVESPIDTWVTALTLDGATIRLQRRVPPGVRVEANSELRRRLSVGVRRGVDRHWPVGLAADARCADARRALAGRARAGRARAGGVPLVGLAAPATARAGRHRRRVDGFDDGLRHDVGDPDRARRR